MDADEPSHNVTTLPQLEALFGAVIDDAVTKEIDYLHPLYRRMIEAAPFAILATAGKDGLDASARGDAPGFVAILDEKTLLLPERRGNNRIDSLRNILADPRVALLFLIPGIDETLRVQGRATITVDPDLLQRFAIEEQLPKCVIAIRVESVFFGRSRAIRHSGLWKSPATLPDIPSPDQILAALAKAL